MKASHFLIFLFTLVQQNTFAQELKTIETLTESEPLKKNYT